MTEFRTVKRIDNSRLVRNTDPVRMSKMYRTAALGGFIALFFVLYIFQHFRCIDLSFQLEDLRSQQAEAAERNAELKLRLEQLSDPRRIDHIARNTLGLTQPLPGQVHEFEAPNPSQAVEARLVQASHRRSQ